MPAEGHSMWPLIHDGDLVRVEPLDGPIALGDLVLFSQASRLVLHRVIAVSGLSVTTKGDAVAQADGIVALDAILGRLPRTAPRLNRLCARLSAMAGRPLAFALQRLRLAVSRL